MEKALASGPTRVASVVFFVVGLFTFTNSMDSLRKLLPSQLELKPLYILLVVWSIASLIDASYLLKGKKWSYILAFILIAAIFGINAYTYFIYGKLNVLNIGVGVVTLFLLIAGRKDFSNK